jgi:hypothetical protein
MQIPIIRGIIDRRILVNFRVDAAVLARLLPAPFRPKLVNGAGMAGVCLIRLKHIRPRFLPAFLGITSENAAHRIAVGWDQDGETREGVFIPRRDTSSWLNALAGGRLFPGVHHHAAFRVQEHEGRYRVELNSDDRRTHLLVEGRVAPELPPTSIFGSLKEASDFFERGFAGVLGEGQTRSVRRPGTEELRLAGAAPGRRKSGIEFFREPEPLPDWFRGV